jgi:hypothetical protein
MDQAQKTFLAVLSLVLAGLLVACSQSGIRVGWVETSSPGHVGASYVKFTGTETRGLLAQAGKTLYLEYDAEVETGVLCMEVKDPFGRTIWRVFLCEDCGETQTLPMDEDGCYTIFIEGDGTEGGFDLSWEQR